MATLPSEYEKYDDETTDNLVSLLESIEHLRHILNGIHADIMNGNYSEAQAKADAETVTYAEGVDFFSALDDVALSAWTEKETESV
jgi:hypothetical protein